MANGANGVVDFLLRKEVSVTRVFVVDESGKMRLSGQPWHSFFLNLYTFTPLPQSIPYFLPQPVMGEGYG